MRCSCIRSESRIDDIASKVFLPPEWREATSPHPAVPPILVVNCQVCIRVSVLLSCCSSLRSFRPVFSLRSPMDVALRLYCTIASAKPHEKRWNTLTQRHLLSSFLFGFAWRHAVKVETNCAAGSK